MCAARRRPQRPRTQAKVVGQKPLMVASDHGSPLTVSAEHFAPKQQDRGWGPYAETFMRLNEAAFGQLGIEPRVEAGTAGTVVRLVPGALAGAMPLRSAQTGQVAGGIVVRPRFGWAGVGRVLKEIGWHAAPKFSNLPLVPGSGREVPPWVIAGPVLARLAELLRSVRRGYRPAQELLTRPRGRILWNQYIAGPLARGSWHHLPCRFPDLASDPLLRSLVKWCLGRVRRGLTTVGGADSHALLLVSVADRLLAMLNDVPMVMPGKAQLDQLSRGAAVNLEISMRQGLEAMGWVVDERGLGGGREMDGLAWSLSLPELWETYVETVVRHEAALVGAAVRSARKRETILPIQWSSPGVRAMSHLAPDFIVRRGGDLHIIDAKYKAHFAELDETGWYRMGDDARESHRGDFLQALAYASVFGADRTTVTLVYPLRKQTFDVLRAKRRDVARAEISYGGRPVRAELRGIPFGEAAPRVETGQR